MKKLLAGLALALSASAAFAQYYTSPAQVCQNMARINSTNATICAQLISQNQFDQGVLMTADTTLQSSTANAIQVLRVGANKRMDAASGDVCVAIAKINTTNAIPCVEALADTLPSPDLLNIANRLAQSSTANAVQALRAGANAYLFPPMADICADIVSVNSTNAVVCVQVIANKISMNGAEQICRTNLSNGSSASAIQCLRNIVVDYVPAPPMPTTLMVELYQLQDLKRSMMKARAQMNRGNIDAASRTLDDASLTIDQILRSNNQ